MLGNFLSSCTTGGFSRKAQLHGVIIVIITTDWMTAGVLLEAYGVGE
jgi:hypothetical protein